MRVGPLERPAAVILAAIALVGHGSCYSYRAVMAERRNHSDISARAGVSVIRVNVEKSLARMTLPGPLASINNRGVELAGAGRFDEAELLFREVIAENRGEPAGYNNLAVVCEITGNRGEAFRMYAEACRLDPGNPRFRNNFQTFADFREEAPGRP